MVLLRILRTRSLLEPVLLRILRRSTHCFHWPRLNKSEKFLSPKFNQVCFGSLLTLDLNESLDVSDLNRHSGHSGCVINILTLGDLGKVSPLHESSLGVSDLGNLHSSDSKSWVKSTERWLTESKGKLRWGENTKSNAVALPRRIDSLDSLIFYN
jgi:hypothetical protein